MFRTISFKIWLSFTGFLILVFGFLIVYFPNEQRKALTDFKKSELHEIAVAVSLAIEGSLNNDDFISLKSTLERTVSKKDFEFVALVIGKGSDRQVLVSYPELDEKRILNERNNEYIYDKSPFSSDSKDLSGEVIISFSKDKINKTVSALVQPVYYSMLLFFLVSLVIFYFVARLISRPIQTLIGATNLMKLGDYNTPIQKSTDKDEIASLNNSLVDLQMRLRETSERNRQLTEGLEEEITNRTYELEKSTNRLIEAQRNARICNFQVEMLSEECSISDNFYDILQLKGSKYHNLSEFVTLIDKDQQAEIIEFVQSNCINSDSFELDIKVNQGVLHPVWLFCSGKCERNGNGEISSISGTLQDITYRKKIEEELEELSLVAKNTSNCVIITDINQRIKWVNQSVLKLTGYSYDEIIGNTPKMFQFEKTDPATLQMIREKLENEQEVKTEILNRGKHGNEYWLELNIVPLRSRKGVLYGYMAVETDITELKSTSEEIKRMNENLESRVLENTRKNLELSRTIVEQEKLATIGEISAGIAHDLNTPLGSAKVGAESLQMVLDELSEKYGLLSQSEQVLANEVAKTYPSSIAVSGMQKMKDRLVMERLLIDQFNFDNELTHVISQKLIECSIPFAAIELIGKIVSLSDPLVFLSIVYNLQMKDNLLHTILLSTERAANVVKDVRSFINKGVTPERLSIDLEKNIRVVLNVFNHELKKQLKLDTSFEDGLFIQGYDIKLFQLWSNLIKNALDAMEEKSNKQIRIETKSDAESIIVIVSNNGPKIPETIQSQIFNKFFSTKRDKNGTGLGLSIVKNVVDEHNAKIFLDSNDEWTSFKIEFPVEKMN